MNKIEKRELKGELKYKNTTVLTYSIEYPEIVSSKCEFGKKIFNNYNREKAVLLERYVVDNLYRSAKDLYDYNNANGYPVMAYDIVSKYTITCNENYLVSLYDDVYEFTGGAHGNTKRTSQNWDLRVGKMLPLSYFYPNNTNYVTDILKNINNQIKQQMQSSNSQYFDNYCELVLESFNLDNYYVTLENVFVFFQQYDIAPYSSGIPVFNVKTR